MALYTIPILDLHLRAPFFLRTAGTPTVAALCYPLAPSNSTYQRFRCTLTLGEWRILWVAGMHALSSRVRLLWPPFQ